MKVNNKGQSIFEVILALGLISLIIVAIVAMAGISIKNSSFSRNTTLATRYSEEALEWLRGQRDDNWDVFYSKALNLKWCLPTLTWLDAEIGACGEEDQITGTSLSREVNFSFNPLEPSSVETTVKMYWIDAGGYHEVSSVTSFSDWRESK
jgi:Tfp pilus assembly protein PilV